MKPTRQRNVLIFIGILVITSVACSCGALNTIMDQIPVSLNDLNPEGIATAVAEQLPNTTFTVEELLKEGMDQLEGADEAQPRVNADQRLGDVESGYVGLESYRTRMVMTVDGQDESGNAVQTSLSINQETNRAQNANHLVMDQQGIRNNIFKNYEFYAIGDSFYIVDANNEMGMDMPCFAMSSSAMDDEMNDFAMLSPDDVFGGMETGDLIARGEMVNGLKTDHYRLKKVDLENSSLTMQSGEVWVAQNGGFIVRVVGEGEGNAGMFSDELVVNGKLRWEFDLLDVNQKVEITLPDVCVQAAAQGVGSLPTPPNASDIQQFGPMLTLTSTDAPSVLAEFYKQELSAAGYTLAEESDLGGMFMFTFTKEDQTLNVIITQDEGSGSTVIVTTEDIN